MTYGDLVLVFLGLVFVVMAAVSSFRSVARSTNRTRSLFACLGGAAVLFVIAALVPMGLMPASIAGGLIIGSILGLIPSPRLAQSGAATAVPLPPPPPLPEIGAEEALVSIVWPGMYFLVDTKFALKFDDASVDKVSVVNPYRKNIRTSPGHHTLEVKVPMRRPKKYTLDCHQPGYYSVLLEYSRTWGNFLDACRCEMVRGPQPAALPRPLPTDINFACPRCGQHIASDPGRAGVETECPNCKRPVQIPRL